MIGDIISAGANLIGGFMGRQSAREANAANERIAQQNIALQKQFAQEGIRWKVEDAKAAGIHPLYALGAQTSSFSPVSVGAVADSSMPNAMAAMGQNLGRAVNATRTSSERDQAFIDSTRALDLEGKKLDNDIKRASLASAVRTATQAANPPMPGGPVPIAKEVEDAPRMHMGRGMINLDRYWTNTDDATNRWGESADWWYGPQVMWADYKANYGAPKWMPTFRPGSWLHRTFGDSFDSRFKGER